MNLRDPFMSVPQVDAVTTHEQWQSGEATLVDVREQDEWELGHVEGVKWIPLGQLPVRWKELDPGKKWICVCRLGSRSNYAAAMLRQAGLNACNMRGGMLEWQLNKLPITEPGIVESH